MTTATIDRIMKAAAKGDRAKVEDIIEALLSKAEASGATDTLIDLWQAGEVTEEGIEIAKANKIGVKDPR
jgi:hypothetical protein